MSKRQFTRIFKSYLTPLNLIILILILGVLISLFLVFFQKGLRKEEISDQERKVSTIEIQDDDRLLSVDKDGQAKLETPTGVFYQTWESDKTDAFFQYIKTKIKFSKPISEPEKETDDFIVSLLTDEKWQGFPLDFIVSLFIGDKWRSFTVDGSDKLINLVFEEVSGGYSSEEIAEGDIVDYFRDYSSPQSDTPSQDRASQDDSSSQDSDTSSQDTSSETSPFEDDFFEDAPSQDSSPQDDYLADLVCPYWRLSYCVYPPPSSPPPSIPVTTPTRVIVPDCDLWEAQVTKRTVISNTLCIEEPGE